MQKLKWIAALSGALATGLPIACHAALGGTVDTVQSDQVQMKATRKAAAVQTDYTVHELTLDTGTVVREYANTTGTVFAVTWQGPLQVDLSQILGDSFTRLTSVAASTQRSTHRALVVRDSDLVIESTGKMGSFSGRAYLPGQMPASVSVGDIQ